MLTKFNPKSGPQPAFYSRGVIVEAAQRTVYISGQVGERADGTLGANMTEQVEIAIDNLKGVLAHAEMGLEDVVKYTIYLTDPEKLGDFLAAGRVLLPSPPPAVTLLYVKALFSPDMLVEIEAVAAK